MKYLITESQAKIAAAFLKLDMKNFIQIKKDDSIYFAYSKNDELAQIRYDEDSELCYINIDLNKEISSLFSLRRDESQKVISRWVENTLKMKVTKTTDAYMNIDQWLRMSN